MTSANGTSYNFKVVLLGEGAVGKTSIVLRYIESKFNPKHITTLQASFLNKKINIDDNRVNLSIWDTAGQERFHALGPIYYRGSNGAILVYDITDEESFQKVKSWVKELKKMLGNDVTLAIAGNKIDLAKDRQVSLETAEEYARGVGAKHYETSAKLNEGIDDLFLALATDMIAISNVKNQSNLNRQGSTRRGNALVLEDESEEGPENEGNSVRSRCCA